MIARAAAHWRANALGLLLVACGGNGAPDRVPADTRLPTCAPYKGMDNAWGYCIYKLAGGFPTRQDVEDLCPQSGAWEDQCRHAWVAGRMQPNSGVSTEDLLAVCAGNADCAFELIDFRPEAEVTDQIARCHEYAGRHGEDCVGHAVQRWWIQDPDADEVARIQALDLGFPRQVGFFVAASTFCAGVGSCAGFIENQRICETQLEVFRRRPETCPQKTWAVMEHNQDRGAPQGPGPNGGGVQGPAPGTVGGGPGAMPGDPPGLAPQDKPTPPRHVPGTIPPSP